MSPGEWREGRVARRGEGAEMSTVQRLLAGGVLCQLLLTWNTYQDVLSLHRGLSALMHSHASPHTRSPTRSQPPSSLVLELCLRFPGPLLPAIDCKFMNLYQILSMYVIDTPITDKYERYEISKIALVTISMKNIKDQNK